MPAPSRRLGLLRLVAAILTIGLLAIGAAPVQGASGYSRDLYFAAGYERQVDNRTCTMASTAMMMNFIARRDLNLDQLWMLSWAQPRDALNDATQRGSDPLGWARAATSFSYRTGRSTTYQWEGFGTAMSALRRSAKQIAITGKPVGMVVQNGRHAIVMTGFTATGNPATAASWTLETIWYSDPYGYAHRSVAAGSTPLNRYLETDATPHYDTLWYRKYIVIVPQN